MTTLYRIPLANLPEEFFIEELQYYDKKRLEAMLENPIQKIENASIIFHFKDYLLSDEEDEQIMAYAPKSALLKAIELASYHDEWETIE